MDSCEILRQYISGALNGSSSISELEKLLVDTVTTSKLQESAKARYVIGFIRRVTQFKRGEASERDLCLNIRDIVLVLGRVKLTQQLYDIVKAYGKECDLLCENDLTVSCLQYIPCWLSPDKYIKDVYSLSSHENLEMESPSAGDNILKTHTRFRMYKSYEQKLAVHTALNLPAGHTLLISQPTGGGKSLVTQMLSATTPGLTMVIVPTVALALDQFYAAKDNITNNNEIYCYRGKQSENERISIIKALREKRATLLFTSPEAIFKNTELYNLLGKAASDGYLTNIVVDEAHIVPDWGVFFRPDFQIFSIVLRKWRKISQNTIRTFLLSATLSDDVVDTLFSLFGAMGNNIQLRCDALRQEPRFYFYSAKSKREQDEKTIEAIRLLPKPMVVYVLEPKEAIDLQKQLRDKGYQNIPTFTGETKEEIRDTILKGWKKNEYDVVIATSAFGIGVDKPDVRTIIHACVPENISRFYQEVGRGGRDRLPSISLFLPYQSNRDGDGDVRRALGLVNKRVLTVERTVIRWYGMLKSPSSFISADRCILDTSATPPTMTEEEAEFAGNRNVAWNINLLLFLNRTGFLDLEDASFQPQKNAYLITAKLLRPEILGDSELLTDALQEPRQHELNLQLSGYYVIRDLVAHPTSVCWGHVFKHIFPLASEVCNGCPADPEEKITCDATYKLRVDPELSLPATTPSYRLDRHMGSFSSLVVRRTSAVQYDLPEVESVCDSASQCGVGVLILPEILVGRIDFSGLVLGYNEFYFTAAHAPYLFASGVLCIFSNDENTNHTLYKNLRKLEEFNYRRLLYCNENMTVSAVNKSVHESDEGYSIAADKL